MTTPRTSPVDARHHIVDVDEAVLSVTGAVWIAEALHLTLEPITPDATRSTEFRIIGVEPRLWWLTGIDGATIDSRSHGVLVRTPLVAGTIELTPGSY